MKKWQRITLIILALGVLGGLASPFRTTVRRDSVNRELAPEKHRMELKDEREKTGDFHVDYTWKLHAHPSRTLLLGSLSPDAFSLLEEAEWKISLEVREGGLHIRSQAPDLHARDRMQRVDASFSYKILPSLEVMRPDGTRHPIHTIRLGCEVDIHLPEKSEPIQTFAFQDICLDLVDGTADLVSPSLLRLQHLDMDSRLVISQEETGLPALLCGSPCEKALTGILLRLSSIDSRERAEMVMMALPKDVQETLDSYADPAKSWPDCWGEEAETAQRIARRIVPALLRFREEDCYDFAPLARFINGSSFSRIFGESFADYRVPDDTQGSIRFERVEDIDAPGEAATSSDSGKK